jgi:hypothetical protein
VLSTAALTRTGKHHLGDGAQVLQVLQSFYHNQKAIMSNDDFDNLKEERMWEGKHVVMLSN